MNGRVFDPLIARFLSGDPIIQDPLNGQNYSRYTYVYNNPTNTTDPTGFIGSRIEDEKNERLEREAVKEFNNLSDSDKNKILANEKHAGILQNLSGVKMPSAKNPDTGTKENSASGSGHGVSGSAISGGGGAAERFVESHRKNVEGGNGAVYEPLQPYAVAATGGLLFGPPVGGWLAGTPLGQATLASMGLAFEVQGVADGGPPGGGIAGWEGKAAAGAERQFTQYEVIAEVRITGTSRSAHRASANRNLAGNLAKDADYRNVINGQLGHDALAHMKTGKSGLRNPLGTEWHHPINNSRVMQLLRKTEHRSQQLQEVLHPEDIGGFIKYFGK